MSVKPDFSHRMTDEAMSDLTLVDSVHNSARRAKGILTALGMMADKGILGAMTSDDLSGAIDSVIFEVDDINALVTAFYDKSKGNANPAQKQGQG
jgi:hypothetical protein